MGLVLKKFLKKIILSVTFTAAILGFAWFESPSRWEVGAAIIEMGKHTGFKDGEFTAYPGSQNITARNLKFNGIPIKLLSFETPLPMSQIAQYYIKPLERQGWKDLTVDFVKFISHMGPPRTNQQTVFPPHVDFRLLFAGDKASTLILQRDTQRNVTKCLIAYSDLDKEKLLETVPKNSVEDVPGVDPRHVPRYPASQRIVNLQEESPGSNSIFSMYNSQGTAEDQIRFFRQKMQTEGWDLDRTVEGGDKDSKVKVMSFTQDSKTCLVILQDRFFNPGTETLVVYKEKN